MYTVLKSIMTFPESNTGRFLLGLVVVFLIILFACQAGYADCSKLRGWFTTNTDVPADSEKKEGFDSSPYADMSSSLYQAGINDERDDNMPDTLPWQESINVLGLEQSVIDSHRAFTNDSSRVTTTASNMPVREYDDGPVPFAGLRRPEYHKVQVGSTARTVPSEYSDQMAVNSGFMI